MILQLRVTFGVMCLAAFAGAAYGQSLTEVASLSFGSFVAVGAGSVSLDAQGLRSQTGEVYLMHQGAMASVAQFVVSGVPFTSYAVTLPANGVAILSDGRGHSLAVNGFVSSMGAFGTLAPNGSGQFRVGASLMVAGMQVPGTYSGVFNITLEYQ
jgi:Domain of unknown function (DUF4402)